MIGLTQLRNDPQFVGIDGNGFSVAVIDTGLDREHSLSAPNINFCWESRKFIYRLRLRKTINYCHLVKI